ncbi:spore coat protein U domain-containing protein [Rhodococcus sp. IEGM1300]
MIRHLLLMLALSSAHVQASNCSVSATPLNFGAVKGLAGKTGVSTATLSVICRTDVATTISYSLAYVGAEPGASRALSNGSARVAYQLFVSSTDSMPWSISYPITDSYALAAGSSVTRTYTVYAKVQPGRDGLPGTYSDIGQVQLIY